MDFRKFSSITSDSREVRPGSLFVAIAGGSKDGHDFIDEVIAKGAAAIIGERELHRKIPVPYTRVNDSRLALAEAAAAFYGHPSRSMKVLGVTGTSGKTTTTYALESILHAAGFKVGVIGTVNYRYGDAREVHVLPSTHTTPGPVELQRLIATMREKGVTHLVAEVSSHALSQKRAHGIRFDVAAFTNLTPEHLDFHRDMEDYFAAKKILFTDLSRAHVINLDDPYGERLFKELPPGAVGFSLTKPAAIDGRELHVSVTGITGKVGPDLVIESTLMARYNASNLLTAIGMARALDIPATAIAEGIRRLKVPGRMERVPNTKGIHVFVDYAHKPDALEKVLTSLQAFRQEGHRLITVFGCGGDRDRTKRPVMGKIAQNLSDLVIVTSDNPRTEDPEAIIREILQGMGAKPAPTADSDRRRAIQNAISVARPGDIVLIAGKGHEDYQIIGTQKHPFDDREVAAQALAR